MGEVLPYLVFELSSPYGLPTSAIPFRTSRLHHESTHHSVEQLVVIVTILGVSREVFDCEWALLAVELQVNLTHRSVDDCLVGKGDLFGLLLLGVLRTCSVVQSFVHEVATHFVNFSVAWLTSRESVEPQFVACGCQNQWIREAIEGGFFG